MNRKKVKRVVELLTGHCLNKYLHTIGKMTEEERIQNYQDARSSDTSESVPGTRNGKKVPNKQCIEDAKLMEYTESEDTISTITLLQSMRLKSFENWLAH